MYCDVRDFTQFVGVDYETLVKILKRKYRSVDVPSSFRSRMFHAPVKGCFFSVKCFKLLYGKNYIKKVGPGINKATVVKELDDLLEKYTKESDEMEEDDIVQMITSDNEEDSNPQVIDFSQIYPFSQNLRFLVPKLVILAHFLAHFDQFDHYVLPHWIHWSLLWTGLVPRVFIT